MFNRSIFTCTIPAILCNICMNCKYYSSVASAYFTLGSSQEQNYDYSTSNIYKLKEHERLWRQLTCCHHFLFTLIEIGLGLLRLFSFCVDAYPEGERLNALSLTMYLHTHCLACIGNVV